ncbi:unnamed protein product [Cunninghamella echinulata]
MNTLNSYSIQIFDTITQLQKQFDDINLKHEELSQQIKNTRDNGITEDELANVKTMTSEYNTKLLSLRTTMVNMSIKSKQLIQRADKLKATKIEYLSKVDTIRKLEQERDKSIAARIVDKNNNNDHINKPLSLSPSSSSSSSLSLNTKGIEKNKISSSSSLLSSSPIQQTNIITSTTTTLENKLSSSYSSSSIIIPSNNNNNISRSSSSSSILTPLSSPPPTHPTSSTTPILHEPSNSSSTTTITSTTTVMSMAKKKKKKKPKVREVVIGDDDDEPAWVPKKSLSNQINNS